MSQKTTLLRPSLNACAAHDALEISIAAIKNPQRCKAGSSTVLVEAEQV